MTAITTSHLAHLYTVGVDATKELEHTGSAQMWRWLVEDQFKALVGLTGVRVTFVEGQPFDGEGAAERMLDYIARTKHLPVSTDFNESELNGERGNLLFRAAHDLSHYLCDQEHAQGDGERCNFALDGETRAFARQARHLLDLYNAQSWTRELTARERRADRTRLVQIAFSEVVLQAAVFYQTGDFAAQKVVQVGIDTINAWLRQQNLPALAV